MSQGDLDGARADFDRALEASPDLVGAIAGRAHFHLLFRDPEAALADASRAIERAPPAERDPLRNRGRAPRAPP